MKSKGLSAILDATALQESDRQVWDGLGVDSMRRMPVYLLSQAPKQADIAYIFARPGLLAGKIRYDVAFLDGDKLLRAVEDLPDEVLPFPQQGKEYHWEPSSQDAHTYVVTLR